MEEQLAATVGFVGNPDDPWVGRVIQALAAMVDVQVVTERADRPGLVSEAAGPQRVLIVHRSTLSPRDASRLAAWRPASSGQARQFRVLCYGPYVRYAELERCSPSFDRLVPEATAAEVLPALVRRVLRGRVNVERPAGEGRPVEVVSSNAELRDVLSEAARLAGFRPLPVPALLPPIPHDETDSRATRPVLWDVPVLESGWEQALRERSACGPVIALLGFADRGVARLAIDLGATACLELPFELEALLAVLARLAHGSEPGEEARSRERVEPAHRLPRAPALWSPQSRSELANATVRPARFDVPRRKGRLE